eukprot:1162021-Pelagomonas_calceolata.AAC.15
MFLQLYVPFGAILRPICQQGRQHLRPHAASAAELAAMRILQPLMGFERLSVLTAYMAFPYSLQCPTNLHRRPTTSRLHWEKRSRVEAKKQGVARIQSGNLKTLDSEYRRKRRCTPGLAVSGKAARAR